MPVEGNVDEDFDIIFGTEPDNATRSKLAISPPKLNRARNATPEGGKTVLDRLKDQGESVDYELDSQKEEEHEEEGRIEATPKKTKLDAVKELDSVSITPAKASEMLNEILRNRPPKISPDLPIVPSALSTSVHEGPRPKLVAPVAQDVTRTLKCSKSLNENKVERKKDEKLPAKAKLDAAKAKTEDTKNTSEPTPIGYPKQNFDRLQAQAIEKKRNADGLKDGKELPVYLKALSLYASAYSHYEVFGTDSLEKWKGLVEFALQIEKKCAGYKNDITVGLCNAILAWTHQKLVAVLLQDLQSSALPLIEKPASLIGPSIAVGLTQIGLHHEKTRQGWLKAVNLVPGLSKYGFSVYSSVEDLCKTIDRYI